MSPKSLTLRTTSQQPFPISCMRAYGLHIYLHMPRPPAREPIMNQTLEQEVSQLHAEICAGLADPTRILILYELASGPRNVTQLTETLKLSQPMVSRHLKVLR